MERQPFEVFFYIFPLEIEHKFDYNKFMKKG